MQSDRKLWFNAITGQTTYAASGTFASTDVVDVGIKTLGEGTDIPVIHTIKETYVGNTGLTIAVQGATVSTFGAPVTLASMDLDTALAVKGTQLQQSVAMNDARKYQYMRVLYTLAGTATSGSIHSCIGMGSAGNEGARAYVDGRTFS